MSTRGRRMGRAGAPPEVQPWRSGKVAQFKRTRNSEEVASEADAPTNEPSTSTNGANEAERRGIPGNRYLEMKDRREDEKAAFIKAGLMNDPYKPVRMEDAIDMVGTCMDMCPEFERHEREFQNNVDKWEAIDPTAKPRRIDHVRAVKVFQRATQGTEPIPSDLRPLPVLQKTLNYLFHTLLGDHGLETTREFIWDRTRAIRREFTMQRLDGPEVAELLERIARYHALVLFRFSHLEENAFSIRHEREQLDKSLQSLIELYDDGQGKYHFPNEAEFRAFRQSRQAFYAAFDKIRSSKTSIERELTDPSDIDIIDGFYQPREQTALPPPALSGIPMKASLGAAPGAYIAKPRPGPIERPYANGPVNGHAEAMPPPPVPSRAFAGAINGFGSLSAAAPAASVFGTNSVFGKGLFGAQPQTATPAPAPAFSGFTPAAAWGAPPGASTTPSTFGVPGTGGNADAPQGNTSTTSQKQLFGFPSSDKLGTTSSLFPPADQSATSNSAAPSWSFSPMPATTNPLFAGFATSPSNATTLGDAIARDEDAASQREAAVAAAAEEAAREAQRAAKEAADAAAAEEARIQRQRQQEENEKREHTLKEQLRVRVSEERHRAEAERARLAAEAEAEADRLAEEELAAAAALAHRQAEEDAVAAAMADELLLRAEQPLIAEQWDRVRLMRKMLGRWKDRALQVALLLEQTEVLKRKRDEFRASVKNLLTGSPMATPKRDMSSRARKHSGTPVSDAERARELEDESKRHAQLWKAGSFMTALRSTLGNIPQWEIWLCPASREGTSSAWLKTKLGIEAALSEDAAGVFRLPIYEDISKAYYNAPSSPGLLLVELSGDVPDDCRRLRAVLDALPSNRLYAVSLLLLKFSGSETDFAAPLKELIQSFGKSGLLADARALVLTTSHDLDKQFTHAVSSLKLDLTGTLVQRVSLDAFLGAFSSAWEVSLNTWVSLCTDSTGFNWPLYGAVLSVMFAMLNELSNRVALAAGHPGISMSLPQFDWRDSTNSETAFEAVIHYLMLPAFLGHGEAELLRTQLSDVAAAGGDFPVYALPERISQLVATAIRNSKGARHIYLPKNATADSITEDFRNIMQAQLSALQGMIRYTAPSNSPSPSDVSMNGNGKKRSMEEMEWDDDSNFVINGFVHTNGHSNGAGAKRQKTVNGSGRASPPSPALSTVSLMSTSSLGSSRRGEKLLALMDKMRASLRRKQ